MRNPATCLFAHSMILNEDTPHHWKRPKKARVGNNVSLIVMQLQLLGTMGYLLFSPMQQQP